MSIEASTSWIDCTALRHGAKSANSDNKMRSAAASDGLEIECGHILLDEIWWSRNLKMGIGNLVEAANLFKRVKKMTLGFW